MKHFEKKHTKHIRGWVIFLFAVFSLVAIQCGCMRERSFMVEGVLQSGPPNSPVFHTLKIATAMVASGVAHADDTKPKTIESESTSVKEISTWAQFLIILSAFVIKPIHMVLSLLLIILLRKAKEKEWKTIRWGLILFLFGETACALNYLGASHASLALDLLHDLGMIGIGAFCTWGVFQFLDHRIVHFSREKKRCALQGVCGHCHKFSDVSCGMIRLSYFILLAAVVLAIIPFSKELESYDLVFLVFSSEVGYYYSIPLKIAQFRIYPAIAIILFLVAFIQLWKNKGTGILQEACFFAGVGILTFTLTRFFLNETFHDAPFWADFWEETTELITVAGIGVVLWVFRKPSSSG